MMFFLLAALSILLSLAAVLTKHIFRSAIFLMGVLTLSAGLYLLLNAEFLAGVQILVYVGGVVVLLVFAVMLTQSEDLAQDNPTLTRRLLAALTACLFFFPSAVVLLQSKWGTLPPNLPALGSDLDSANFDSVAALGRLFLSPEANGYLVPFELVSLLLLTVLIAGVVLAKKERPL